MKLSTIPAAIVGWLRAGYSEQAPRQGCNSLLALMPTRLGEDEWPGFPAEETASSRVS